MKTNYKLNIENPCKKKNWAEMEVFDKSRFCSLCSKSVFDFKNWSDEQIINFLNKSEDTICARLSHQQMNRIISIKEKSKINNWQNIAASILLIYSTNSYAAENNVHVVDSIQQFNSEKQLNQFGELYSIPGDSIKNIISGTLIEEDSKKPIPNVVIEIKGTDLKTETDSLGHFTFIIPTDYSNEEIVLLVDTEYGFEGQTDRIIYKNELPVTNLLIEKPDVMIGEIIYFQPKKWWQFWKKKYKS